jgi:hypothetical protein
MLGGPLTNTGAAAAGANTGGKKQPRSANFKSTNGNRWSVGKDHPGMTWDESLAGFFRSRRLGIDGASRAVKPRTIEEYEWDLGLFFDFVRSRGITTRPTISSSHSCC